MPRKTQKPRKPQAVPQHPQANEMLVDAVPNDLVSFNVICAPRSGVGLTSFRESLNLKTLQGFLPEEETWSSVANRLRNLGFRVFDARLSVCAQGPVSRFESVFRTTLVKKIRRVSLGDLEYRQEMFELAAGAPEPNVSEVAGALFVGLAPVPIFVDPRLPPPQSGLCLRVPGDIAQLTGASATHRLSTPAGQRATGEGIAVAMLDSGFSPHPFFADHGYHVFPDAAADVVNPADVSGHGTKNLAMIVACAPDAHVWGIKMGPDSCLAFDRAMAHRVRVISCSWVHDLTNVAVLPSQHIPLRLQILQAIESGVTVVCAAGNGHTAFPAMMPEVLAVGGAAIDQNDAITVSSGASSFASQIYPGRNVPDLCGFAFDTRLPDPQIGGGPATWATERGTSGAAPQVAGVCALLLQKQPALTLEQIRTVLQATATDVVGGTSAFGHQAVAGPDLATGAGLVNALAAWQATI